MLVRVPFDAEEALADNPHSKSRHTIFCLKRGPSFSSLASLVLYDEEKRLQNNHILAIIISVMWQAQKQSAGFTIVELLIVIVVIAILAAITIVAYNGIQNRANDSSVQANLATLAKQFELYKVDNGTYPPSDTELATLKAKVNKAAFMVGPNTTYNLVPCLRNSNSEYALAAISKSGKRFYVSSSASGVKEFTGASSWTDTDGYSVPCGDLLSGSAMPVGGGNAIGYSAAWMPWLNN